MWKVGFLFVGIAGILAFGTGCSVIEGDFETSFSVHRISRSEKTMVMEKDPTPFKCYFVKCDGEAKGS